MQKSYYNVPLGVSDLNSKNVAVKVFPNPASSIVNIEVGGIFTGDMLMEVTNMVGQKVASASTTDHKAQIDISSIATGWYIVDCYNDGVKVGTSKFIKN